MSMLSRLFGSSDDERARRIINRAEREAAETLQPLGNLAIAIAKASQDCAGQMKPMLDVPDGKEKKEAEVLVFYEFVYFFMHMTMRSASVQMTEQQIQKLQGYLGPLISSTAVDSFFAHWPEDMKKKIRDEFFDKLNDAEMEYSACKELLSEKNPLTGDSLFSKLARNVVELCGNSMNPAVLTLVISAGADAYKGLQLDTLVKNASKALR